MRPHVALVLSFAALIAAGTAALMLPFSTRGARADLLTALFTSTSAVCVTGLVVVDTGSYWSSFGQAVILILMECGGLGFVIGVTAVRLFTRARIGLHERLIIQETGSTLRLGDQGGLVQRAVLLALAGEALGAIVLWARLAPHFGVGSALWLAVFHAVSAFTNGSFDLFGDFRSLTDVGADPVVLLTIAVLIVVGGLSLVVTEDLHQQRRWHSLQLDTKLVLIGTAVLLLGGTVILFLTEQHNPASLAGWPLGRQLVHAFFLSAASRTAGFTTWDFSRTDERSLFFLLGLMFVGGAPGSMAGGIKVTTTAVMVVTVWSALHGRTEASFLGRRIVPHQIVQALTVSVLAAALIATVSLVISLIEGTHLRAPFLHLLFEITSAFGTVGLSTGVTTQLSAVSQLLLAVTMFVGRLGPVTIALALTAGHRDVFHRLPHELVRIG